MSLEGVLAARRAIVDDALALAFDDLKPGSLRDATRWYPDAGGKRLRPVMAMLACEAAGGRQEDAIPVALAVELVHNFSLVHDDIMDRDETRRGRPTVHVKWSEPTAILAGDVLFARAFEVLARIPDASAHHEASRLLGATVLGLCEGQALDMAFESRETVGVSDYLEMIRLKTALLFEASMRGGALAASAPRGVVEALGRFGLAFGLAFQIADDVLDVTADEKTLGKPWASDVRAGKRTLLVLDALERGAPEHREALSQALGRRDASRQDVERAVRALHESGAVARATAERDRQARAAEEALAGVPPSAARDALVDLNRWAATRGH